MKKIFLYLLIITLISLITIQIYIFLQITNNKNNNNVVLEILNNDEVYYANDNNIKLPNLEINNKNYIGFINISDINLILPIESNCNNTIFNLQSACMYKNSPLIIMATTLSDSIKNYDDLSINNNIIFTNNLGISYQFEITEIKRLNKLSLNYTDNLIIIIKNYFEVDYIIIKANYI